MASRSQIDHVISALVLIRRASSAIDTALSLPAADRAQIEDSLDAVRADLGRLLTHLGGSVPGASVIGRRPEFKAAAAVVEFVARQGAAQLGAVASVADTLRHGDDSRALAQRIERHLIENGVASKEDLAGALGVEAGSARFQEGLERALGTGQAEWYAADVYGVPRNKLGELALEEPEAIGAESLEAPTEDVDDRADDSDPRDLGSAVTELESSLAGLRDALNVVRGGGS